MGSKDFDKFKEAWFRGVYDKHFPELYFYLRSFTTDEELIQDIIQDAFVSIMEKDRLETIANIRTYLYSCVRNSLYNKIKSDKIREKIKMEMTLEAEDPGEETAVNRERLITLTEEAVDNLPTSCKTIFKMAKTEGLSYKQIASRLSLSIKTVETQMGIAFKKIRQYVAAATVEHSTEHSK